ncbi:GTP cyclohydrolase II [Sphingomicrobium astaxanthinifaciens]|uniref:GTP cyclohydrolase II n=1 Tax=Sphingomicrobium astaxanthinifaciens TaxID=1227949 RepID=UPI001FCB5987|nr:GTP cyclohydrolase II [Sphingomicrobium astaxanthinifaciens]MCJ7421189.1 GTP cyclohydrolase II [Sphingomicrobium astaxanthinifaciens]
MTPPLSLERAVARLRLGQPVAIAGEGERLAVLPLETASAAMAAELGADAAPLLLSGERAAALGLGNQKAAAEAHRPTRIAPAQWFDHAAALALVDPAHDFERGPTGPVTSVAPGPLDGAALALLRYAGLLPAARVIEGEGALAAVPLAAFAQARRSVTLVSRASIPLADLPAAQLAVFRDGQTGAEHAAMIIGAFGGRPPLVRLHSECLTGDVFGSLKCDCGPQLDEALRLIGTGGGGILLYLRQEGRGIGLANKLRAYALQDRGLDTVDANRRLGFADDARDYGLAAAMLEALGVREVRLLTNNPAKMAGLEAEGIRVSERVAHHLPTNPHNADYVATKKARSGHLD